eukprot:m.26946 g.26946  ORF g.26946 m.26946 type:complete len:106 (+) comp8384_c0_seq1:52-369(+)
MTLLLGRCDESSTRARAIIVEQRDTRSIVQSNKGEAQQRSSEIDRACVVVVDAGLNAGHRGLKLGCLRCAAWIAASWAAKAGPNQAGAPAAPSSAAASSSLSRPG